MTGGSICACDQANEEFFEAVADLTAKLEVGGHRQAVAELKEGFGCLNGPTDGWSLLLEPIQTVQATHAKRFARDEQTATATIRMAVRTTVYRR